LKNQPFIDNRPGTATAEKANLLQSFFDNALQYQVLLNKESEILAFNDCAFNMNRKYALHDLETGRSIFDYVDASLIDDFKLQCQAALKGEVIQYEHFIEGRWFDFTITAIYDCNKKIIGLSIVGNDINIQKKNAKIIRQQSEYLSNIAWFQSHQLRHPVSSILALLNLIKEEEDFHLTKEYLHALEIVTKQLDAIINTVVKQSREV
jgi:signal transduction histidine kinase